MINCKKALTEGYLVSALVLVAVLMRRSGGVAGMSTPVSDDDVCHSVRCAYHAVEDAIGEPQALMVVVDETAMRGTAVEASTDAGAVCHIVYHDRAVVFNQAHLGAMLEVSITVTNLVVTSHSVAGHEHHHHSDCCE